MKPIELEISGWGPYKQKEVIDFTKLWERGLFLVTGPTGAGKTTIFDAISFAIYGVLSGQMREKNSVRSDFAERETKTYVKLKMQHKGKIYEIYRNPEYQRPKKRKTGGEEYTKERENAILTLPDGSHVEGTGEVTRRMQEILSLDYRQFKQVSMIAQGEFAKILTEKPDEKLRIFRELFGTSVLEQFTANLRTKSKNLYKEVMEYRHRMDEDVKMLQEDTEEWRELVQCPDKNYDEIFRFLEHLQTEYKEQKKKADKEYEKAEKKEKELSLKKAEAVRIGEMFEKLEKKEQELLLLKEQEELYRQKEKVVENIRKAQRIEPDYVRFKNGKEQLKKQQVLLLQTKKEKDSLRTEMKESLFFFENREILLKLLEVESEKEKCAEEKEKTSVELSKKQTELHKRKKEYLVAEESAKEARNNLEKAEEEYRRSAIGIVVKMLKPEMPCPVCGSLAHPAPAQVTDGMTDEKQLKQLRELYEQLNSTMLKVHEKALKVQAEEATLAAELGKIEVRLNKAKLEEKEQEKQIKEENKEVFTEWLSLPVTKKQKQLEQRMTAYQKAQTLLVEKEETEERVRTEMTAMSEKVTEMEGIYKQAVYTQNLKDEQEFLTLLQKKGEERRLEEEFSRFKEQLRSLTDLVKHLKEDCKGKKREDTEQLSEQLEMWEEEKKKTAAVRLHITQKLSEIKTIYGALKEKQVKQEALSKEYGIVKDLDNLASGNNEKRLVFEQYVLSAYFDQVLEAANIRFDKMTAGRYEMFRSEEVADGRSKDNLEICVMDFYTGKSRPVKTLSGGETFKASLALALGLSDVIGRTNGGIRVETLFIDEGFGALDSESLEQACETLNTLVEKDRLIGIISHVQELRERIDNQIVITKTNSGSRIENVLG